jgi:hypothetical protein
MNSEYLLIDPRPLEAFKEQTFSGFKKSDVFKALFKSIDTSKIEDACFWMVECICSGYCQEVLEKCMLHSSKVIHLNSPNLPIFLVRRYKTFMRSMDHIPVKERAKLIHLRNSLDVRHNLIDVAVTLAMAPKHKRYDALPKVDPKTHFQFATIKEAMNATMQILPANLIKFTDPEELRIIMNEVFFNLKNSHGGYEKVCYWIGWLVLWEKRNKLMKQSYEIESRPINEVNPKYSKDMIWLIWELVFEEASLRPPETKAPIQALFQLFRQDYTSGKRQSRLVYLYQSVGYLTLPFNPTVPIRVRHDIFLQTQGNVNILFKSKKPNEVKEYTEPPKPPKKLKGVEKEIVESRLRDLQELELFM